MLSSGKVLVAGGDNIGADDRLQDLSSAELYDPTTGHWTFTGSMHNTHHSERMALQRDGKVLVYGGGYDNYPIIGHELYDPTTGSWIVVPKDQERSKTWRPSADQK